LAAGSWKECKTGSYPCYEHTVSAFGWGESEPGARTFAEAACGRQMTSLMIIANSNLKSTSRMVSQCRSTACTPPPSSP
jgi:hypothetical protein